MEQSISLDTWTSLFLLVSSLGLFLAFILWTDKASRQSNWPIILLVTGFSLVLIQYVFHWTGYRSIYKYAYFFDSAWFLAFGPLLYVYIVRFHHKKLAFSAFHFVLPLIVLLISGYILITTDGFFNTDSIKGSPILNLFWRLKNGWLSIISLTIYWLMTKDFIASHQADMVTQEHQVRKRWTQLVLNFYALFLFAYTSYYVLVLFPFFNAAWDYAISFSMSIGVYGIGYMVFKEPQIFNGELLTKIFLPKNDDKKEASLTDPIIDKLFNQVIHFIQTEKPYLDNELRLVHLADQLGFSTHLLSQIINQKARKNFNQFINEYRLLEAQRLLVEADNLSIKRIYFEVGFNNKATFYSAFKKKFGCTPTIYKSQQIQALSNSNSF